MNAAAACIVCPRGTANGSVGVDQFSSACSLLSRALLFIPAPARNTQVQIQDSGAIPKNRELFVRQKTEFPFFEIPILEICWDFGQATILLSLSCSALYSCTSTEYTGADSGFWTGNNSKLKMTI